MSLKNLNAQRAQRDLVLVHLSEKVCLSDGDYIQGRFCRFFGRVVEAGVGSDKHHNMLLSVGRQVLQ